MKRSVAATLRWRRDVSMPAVLLVGAALLAPGIGHAAEHGRMSLPPLSMPATHERQAGRVVWHDLLTPDLAADERFYGGLFGWSFRDMQRGGRGGRHYVIAVADGEPVAGLLERPPPREGGRRPQWLAYFSTDDVDAAMRAALAHGGRDLSMPRDYPQRGRQTVLRDPQGVAFGVVTSTAGDPPDVLAGRGQWIWSVLLTQDPEHEAAFYQDVFGYDVYDLNDVTDEAQATATDSTPAAAADRAGAPAHLELASHDYARAMIDSLPPRGPPHRSRWLSFVRVDNAWRAAAKAQALGARVVVAPRADRQGGHIAVLADPSGALFGVMDWSDTDEANAVGPGGPK